MLLRGDVSNDLIEHSFHYLHVLNWIFDPKLILDLIEHLDEVNVGTDLANMISRSHTPPAIAELLNVDLPNLDVDVLGDTAVGVMSLIEGSVVQLRSVDQFSLKA
jgi:hypothetical protein